MEAEILLRFFTEKDCSGQREKAPKKINTYKRLHLRSSQHQPMQR